MPKLFQCVHCKKVILGGTYTLIRHVEKCINKEAMVKQTITIESSSKKKYQLVGPFLTHDNIGVNQPSQ